MQSKKKPNKHFRISAAGVARVMAMAVSVDYVMEQANIPAPSNKTQRVVHTQACV
jgi:hypothetical protein